MKLLLKKTLIGLAAAMALTAGGVAVTVHSVDAPASQADWTPCNPDIPGDCG